MGKSDCVDLVMVGGRGGLRRRPAVSPRVDRDAALRELHQSLQRPLAEDEIERRQLSKALLPHVRRFYADYFDGETHLPYYRPSSRGLRRQTSCVGTTHPGFDSNHHDHAAALY